jgi:hypothetical protein
VITGIDKRKRAEEGLKRTNVELAASNKELDAFVYFVSHDLRAPIRSISGFAKILMEDYVDKLDAQFNDYLVRILNGLEKMNKRIDAFLHLSRISRKDIERTQVNLCRIVFSISDELRGTNANRKIEIMIAGGFSASAETNLIRVTHLNGTVKGKSYLVARNGTFLAESLHYLHPYHCRSCIWFGVSSSLHQSPIWIKIIGETISATLSRIAGPENLLKYQIYYSDCDSKYANSRY